MALGGPARLRASRRKEVLSSIYQKAISTAFINVQAATPQGSGAPMQSQSPAAMPFAVHNMAMLGTAQHRMSWEGSDALRRCAPALVSYQVKVITFERAFPRQIY